MENARVDMKGQTIDVWIPESTSPGQSPPHFMGVVPTPELLVIGMEVLMEFIAGRYDVYVIYETGFFSRDQQKQYVKARLKQETGPVGTA